MTKDINWDVIHYRFRNGETAYAISKSLDGKPSKMGIAKRAKREGWERISEANKQTARSLPIVRRASGVALGKRTPENIGIILDAVESGVSPTIAAGLAGIARKTLRRWRDLDPQLDSEICARQAQNTSENISIIKAAGQKDWQAAKFLVQHDPYSKEEYGKQRGDKGQVTIVLNIHRDEVPVDGGTIIDSVVVEEHSGTKQPQTISSDSATVLPVDLPSKESLAETPPSESAEVLKPETEPQKKSWQGDDWRERQTLDVHRAHEQRLAVLGGKR